MEDGFDLFADDEQADHKTRRDELAAQRSARLAALPPLATRSSSEARLGYALAQSPLQPTRLPSVFSLDECKVVLAALDDFVRRHGALRTDRHEKFPTTDVPVSDLSMPYLDATVGAFVVDRVLLRVLDAMAKATRHFRPDHLGLKDLFIVCYSGANDCCTFPSRQSSLALHRDGCLLSFSVLLNPSDAFSGGGTFFKSTGQTVLLEQGEGLIHDARLEHAGAEVRTGQRVVLVGFVDSVEVLEEKARWGSAERSMPGP